MTQLSLFPLTGPSNEAPPSLLEEKSGKDVVTAPKVIDEEAYLTQHGASRQDIGECALHKNIPYGNIRKRLIEYQAKKDGELITKREVLREAYRAKVSAGEIRPPTRTERLIAIANGHPDNEAVQAARRLLIKYGIKAEGDY
jgi:hypothetical protein